MLFFPSSALLPNFGQVLAAPACGAEQLEVLGELMKQSHTSYSRCRLGSGGRHFSRWGGVVGGWVGLEGGQHFASTTMCMSYP